MCTKSPYSKLGRGSLPWEQLNDALTTPPVWGILIYCPRLAHPPSTLLISNLCPLPLPPGTPSQLSLSLDSSTTPTPNFFTISFHKALDCLDLKQTCLLLFPLTPVPSLQQ